MYIYVIKIYVTKYLYFLLEKCKKKILGTPFLTQPYPFRVDKEGIKTEYKGQTICFEFISPIQNKKLNQLQNNEINLIQKKK